MEEQRRVNDAILKKLDGNPAIGERNAAGTGAIPNTHTTTLDALEAHISEFVYTLDEDLVFEP